MLLRTLILTATAVVMSLLICTPQPGAAQFQRQTTAQLIQEYFGKGVIRRAEEDLLEELNMRPRAEMVAPLKTAYGSDDNRAKALTLTAALAVPKMWGWVRKFYDDESLRGEVVNIGLIGRESAATDFLFERWQAAAADSSEFTEVQRGFTEHLVDMKVVEKFVKLLKDKATAEDRKSSAAAILAAQVASSAVDAESALKAFDAFKKKHGEHSRPARLNGTNLFEGEIFMHGKVRPCAKCWWMSGEAKMGLCEIPANWQKGSYLVTVHVKPVGESGSFAIDIYSTNNEWTIDGNIGDGKWTMANSADPDLMSPPLLKNQWNKVVLQIMHDGGNADRHDRMLKVEVNGKLVTDWAGLFGDICYLGVSSSSAEVVVGGAETNKR